MAGTNGDSLLIENRAHVMGMNALEHKGKDAFLFPGGANRAEARNLREPLGPIGENLLLVPGNSVDPNGVNVFERGAQADRAGDVRRAGFKFVRQALVESLFVGDRTYHGAAALVWRTSF